MARDVVAFSDLLKARLDRRTLVTSAAGGAVALSLVNGRLVAAVPGGQRLPVAIAQDGGESIIIGTLGEASTLNPLIVDETEGTWRSKMLFDEFVRSNPVTYLPEPGLASSWEIEDLTITFHIQPNAKFSDGTDVTADDVKFTIEGIVHPQTASVHQSKFTAIEGAQAFIDGAADTITGLEVVDPKTLRVRLATPDAAIMHNMRFVFVLPKAQLEGADLSRASTHPFFQKPIGAGPYIFESWNPGGDFVATANPNFWESGKPAAITRFTHRVIADSSALVNALQSGDIDGSLYANPTLAMELQSNENLTIVVPPYTRPDGWFFNTRVAELSNPQVRRALAMAVNVDAFVNDSLMGLAPKGLGPIAPGSWAHDPNLEPIPYDPATARTMLEEAGVIGKEFHMMCNAGNVIREDWCIRCQADLAEIGVTLNVEFIEWATLVERVTVTHDFEIVGAEFNGATAEPSDLLQQFHSQGTENVTGYSTPELDALLEEAKATLDQEAAKPIYSQIQQILMRDVPMHWAYHRPYTYVIASRFENYQASTLDGGLFRSLPEMTVVS